MADGRETRCLGPDPRACGSLMGLDFEPHNAARADRRIVVSGYRSGVLGADLRSNVHSPDAFNRKHYRTPAASITNLTPAGKKVCQSQVRCFIGGRTMPLGLRPTNTVISAVATSSSGATSLFIGMTILRVVRRASFTAVMSASRSADPNTRSPDKSMLVLRVNRLISQSASWKTSRKSVAKN